MLPARDSLQLAAWQFLLEQQQAASDSLSGVAGQATFLHCEPEVRPHYTAVQPALRRLVDVAAACALT